jgi:hypothetical protein
LLSADQSTGGEQSMSGQESLTDAAPTNRLSPAGVVGTADAGRPNDRAADSIVGTLLGLFPDSNPGAVRELVNEQLARFAGARVTTFIPVLVLRACRDALTSVAVQRAPLATV